MCAVSWEVLRCSKKSNISMLLQYVCYGAWIKFLLHLRCGSSHWMCSIKKMFLEILQKPRKSNCARLSFLINLQALAWSPSDHFTMDADTGIKWSHLSFDIVDFVNLNSSHSLKALRTSATFSVVPSLNWTEISFQLIDH